MPQDDDRSGRGAEEIVERIRRGDRGAEEELVGRYSRGVRLVLSGARRDAPAVDDLFQETFRVAIEKIRAGALREPGKLSGFVCAVARNLAIAHFRRRAAHATSDIEGEPSLASPDPDPLEAVLRAERSAVVRRVLSELTSDRDRRILFRFYIAEDEKEDICRDLALTSPHINRVLFRARERYRELYLEMTQREPR